MLSNGGLKPEDYGGQAVIEGVMMRSKTRFAMAVRKPNSEIEVVTKKLEPLSEKFGLLKLPIVRGVVAFVDSMITGMKIITQSAEIAFEEEQTGKKESELWGLLSVFIAIAFSVGFFMLLPLWLGGLLNNFLKGNSITLAVIEGFVRVFLFVTYISLISLSKDIRRVFEYHGAEHKTINCYESGEELTVENVRRHTRLHKRCGTSFLLLVMLISLVIFIFLRIEVVWLRFASRILLVPFIAGLSYEFIKWAAHSDSFLVKLISFPGLCLQRLSTKEPDDAQIETAVTALKAVLNNNE